MYRRQYIASERFEQQNLLCRRTTRYITGAYLVGAGLFPPALCSPLILCSPLMEGFDHASLIAFCPA
jgi:hypothetical protein